MKKQKGIVLFLSLIVLVIMTVIGIALAVNSNQSIRMAGAGSERVEAMAAAHGAQDSVIDSNRGAILGDLDAILNTGAMLGVTSTVTPMPAVDIPCLRRLNANGVGSIMCRRAEISSVAVFGRNNMGLLTIVTGIEQEVLP